MKDIFNFIQEKLVINKDSKVKNDSKKPDNWVSYDDFDEDDFYDAVEAYGEFEYEDILMALEGEPLYISERKVMSILIDDGLKYSYKNGSLEVESPLYLSKLDHETQEKLYNFLINR